MRHRRTSKCFLQWGSSVGLLGFVQIFAVSSSELAFIMQVLLIFAIVKIDIERFL